MRMPFLLLCLFAATACGSGEGVAMSPPAASAAGEPAGENAAGGPEGAAASPLEMAIPNVRMPAEGLVTGGQLTREQITDLADLGYTTFVSLRPAAEDGTGWEEEFAAEHGITFLRIPVASREDLNGANAELLAGALAESDGGAVVYCKSGNRVGALLALKAHWVDGMDGEAALAFGREAGMTRLEPAVEQILAAEE